MANNKRNNKGNNASISLADVDAIHQKILDSQAALAELNEAKQKALFEMLKAKGAIVEGHTYRDNKTKEILGTGFAASVNGLWEEKGKKFKMFTRWNKSEGRPTICVRGLWADNDNDSETVTVF